MIDMPRHRLFGWDHTKFDRPAALPVAGPPHWPAI